MHKDIAAMAFPPAPCFKGRMRLARHADLERIAVVAAASFYHSTWFPYERPYFRKYPLDTLSSYRASFQDAILDPDAIVVVVEDEVDFDETSHVYEALRDHYPRFEEHMPEKGLFRQKIIVSVAAFSLLPDSPRRGQFQPKDDGSPRGIDDTGMFQDKDPVGSRNMDKFLHPEEVLAFKGRMVIDMMATHPAYWRRGHATTTTNWIIELAKIDRVGLGVAAAPMGKVFFCHKHFKENKNVEIPGYEAHPDSVYAWLGLWNLQPGIGSARSVWRGWRGALRAYLVMFVSEMVGAGRKLSLLISKTKTPGRGMRPVEGSHPGTVLEKHG